MQMDDDVVAGAKSVPITFLTPVGSGALDKAALEVIDFKIDASAMERVTIDHIARAVTRSDEGSQSTLSMLLCCIPSSHHLTCACMRPPSISLSLPPLRSGLHTSAIR